MSGTVMRYKHFPVATLFCVLLLVGCSASTNETVQRIESADGKLWASVSVSRGSALKHDWYGVIVGKANASWHDVLLRKAAENVCTLQGPGRVSIAWQNVNELLVTCASCRQRDFHVYADRWDQVHIRYSFPGSLSD